ncbi:OB-fold nucleic acid binding domain-containing protein [Microbulbifer sp. VAAF005]|uniref:OB-fold nucleic acid binding domain-containing protein n=1 Tax=Microbulbifer sp. VAAF005 TaxID=3034230 RepID=UPI0024AE3F96|nr:OB-fold nucleic acid binding domain-containing protein [Microbulbifer sp. VAAF005]WHI48262.1 OB-fold nucleic acid binding domain-containing protein [Microbulbifer sp. VAAF005]
MENTNDDYSITSLSLREHPISFLRKQRKFHHTKKAIEIINCKNDQRVSVIGLVTCRQRPQSASGVLFLTLEDESGSINIILWKYTQEAFKKEIIKGRILQINGRIQISASHKGNVAQTTYLQGEHIFRLE